MLQYIIRIIYKLLVCGGSILAVKCLCRLCLLYGLLAKMPLITNPVRPSPQRINTNLSSFFAFSFIEGPVKDTSPDGLHLSNL